MKKAVIFDMDGTLWDSVDNIVYSWNAALRELGADSVTITREKLLGLMGRTMDAFMDALLPDLSREQASRWMELMMQTENDYLKEHGAVLLGDVAGVFAKLQEMGYSVCIVSNCQSGYIEAFLEYYHLEALVDDLECYGNTRQGKAYNLKQIIARNGFTDYLYLGDTQGDLDACTEAGVPFLFAAYGFGNVDASVPRIEQLEDLPGYLL